MDKLSMCRICLRGDVELQYIVDTNLQFIYEYLTLMPLESTDIRPEVVCYSCASMLQNCYKLREHCLRSEDLFTQMLNINLMVSQEIIMIPRVPSLFGDEEQDESEIVVKMEEQEMNVKVEETGFETEPFEGVNIKQEEEDSSFVEDDIFQPIFKEEPTEPELCFEEESFKQEIEQKKPFIMKKEFFVPIVKEEPAETTTDYIIQDDRADEETENFSFKEEKEEIMIKQENEEVKNIKNECQEFENYDRLVIIGSDNVRNNDERLVSDEKYNVFNTTNVTDRKYCNIVKNESVKIENSYKPYQCDICKIRFTRRLIFKKHMLEHRCGGKRICGTTSNLLINQIESDEKQCKCSIIRTTRSETPYKCKFCRKFYVRKSSFKKQSRIQQLDSHINVISR